MVILADKSTHLSFADGIPYKTALYASGSAAEHQTQQSIDARRPNYAVFKVQWGVRRKPDARDKVIAETTEPDYILTFSNTNARDQRFLA